MLKIPEPESWNEYPPHLQPIVRHLLSNSNFQKPVMVCKCNYCDQAVPAIQWKNHIVDCQKVGQERKNELYNTYFRTVPEGSSGDHINWESPGLPPTALISNAPFEVINGPRTVQPGIIPVRPIDSNTVPQPKVGSTRLIPMEPMAMRPKKRARLMPLKVVPMKDRLFNPDEHCGVIDATGVQCKRSLTCKKHSMSSRRAVAGRSQNLDYMLATQKAARVKAKLAKQSVTSAEVQSV